MGAVEPLGHEPLDPLAEQLLAGVPEHALHLLVHEHDAAGLVDAHDGVGAASSSCSNRRSADWPSVMSRMAAIASAPESTSMLDRLISRGTRPVLAHREQREVGAHRPRPRVGEVAGAVRGVDGMEALGHEPFDGRADQLVAAIAEHALHLAVHQHDHAEFVDSDDGVRRRARTAARPRGRAQPWSPGSLTDGALPLVITQLSPPAGIKAPPGPRVKRGERPIPAG